MSDVIGELLPLAVGVAVSPVPVIAVILMLFAPRARGTSFGFLLGWVVGILAATALLVWLSSITDLGGSPSRRRPRPGSNWHLVCSCCCSR